MKKIIKHFKRWNVWRKGCLNSRTHKFLVLIGFIKSPTMAFIMTSEERKDFYDSFMNAIKEGNN